MSQSTSQRTQWIKIQAKTLIHQQGMLWHREKDTKRVCFHCRGGRRPIKSQTRKAGSQAEAKSTRRNETSLSTELERSFGAENDSARNGDPGHGQRNSRPRPARSPARSGEMRTEPGWWQNQARTKGKQATQGNTRFDWHSPTSRANH
jgi:hypothetical protein